MSTPDMKATAREAMDEWGGAQRMRYAEARWNPAPENCYTATDTQKIAVCIHRMAGWSNYMRTFQHAKEGRYISAHFTVGLDGSVEQHVDTRHVAWTQGVAPKDFPQVDWPLFAGRNPNRDCIGIECEDGGKDYSDERPMPYAQQGALEKLTTWLFNNGAVAGPAVVGESIISHRQLTPSRRPNDPGAWVEAHIFPRLARAAAAPATQEHSPERGGEPNPALARLHDIEALVAEAIRELS